MNSARKAGVAVCLALLAFMLVPVLSLRAEEYDIPDTEGYFGIYVGGEKAGFAHWSVKKIKAGKKRKYYRFTMEEERTVKSGPKEIKETLSAKANIGMDLSPQTLEVKSKRGSRSTLIKGRVSGGNASLTVQFGTQKPFPPRKVKLKPGTMWSVFAPLCFALRAPDPAEKAVFSRLLEISFTVRDLELTAAKQEMSFQGENITAWKWTDPDAAVTIVLNEDSDLLIYSEKNKKGIETKYISEPEEVARSSYTYEQKAAMDAQKNKKPGKKKPGKDGVDLEELLADAADEMEGQVFTMNLGKISLKAKTPEGWRPLPMMQGQKVSGLRLVCGEDNDIFVNIFFAPGTQDGADTLLEDVLDNMEKGEGDIQNIERKTEIQTFDWDGVDAAGIMLTFISSNTKMKTCLYAVAGESLSVVALPVCSEDDWDDYKDDIFGILRSLSIE